MKKKYGDIWISSLVIIYQFFELKKVEPKKDDFVNGLLHQRPKDSRART